MSGIDEYILGACFIETKPKSLPWDDKSEDGREEVTESNSKTSNDDNYLDEKVNTNHDNIDTRNQGIIDIGKAEDILAKITLGDLKLRDISLTSKKIKALKSNSCTTNKIYDVGLAQASNNTKILPSYTSINLEEDTYYKTTSLHSLNSEKAGDEGMVNSQAKLSSTFGERPRHFYRPSVTGQMSVGYNMYMRRTGYEKSLMHEKSTRFITDTDLHVLPDSAKVVKLEEKEMIVIENTTGNKLTTYCLGNENTDTDGHKNHTDTGNDRMDFSMYKMGSKEKCDLTDTGSKCYSTEVSGKGVDLQGRRADDELTDVKAEPNTEQLRKEIDKEFTFHRLENYLDNSTATKNEMRKGGSVGIGERKMLTNRRPMLTANVRASDLRGRKSRNEGRTSNLVGKQCESTTLQVYKPLSFDSIHITQNVFQTGPSREQKESTNLKKVRNASLEDKNLRKDDAMSSAAVETKRKKRKKQKLDKTKPKTIVANKLSDDDDVFDITPVKDTPWSPSQDDNSTTASKRSERKTKNRYKKAEKSLVTAQDIESEDRMSIQKSRKQSSFKGIGCAITHTEKKLDKSLNIINVAPVGKDGCDFRFKARSNENSKNLNSSIDTHRNDRFPVDKLSLVRMKNDTLDSTPNIIDSSGDLVGNKHDSFSNDRGDQAKRRRKKRKKNAKKVIKTGFTEHSRKNIVNLTNTTGKSQYMPKDKSGLAKNTVLPKTIIDPYYSKIEHRENEEQIDRPITIQDICERNTVLSPINEENVECVGEDGLKLTNDVAEISPSNDPNLEKRDKDTNDSISIVSLHCECRACVGDTGTSVMPAADEVADNNNRGGRWRRFLNWFLCCFKSKVDD